jgi:hypothetical protein
MEAFPAGGPTLAATVPAQGAKAITRLRSHAGEMTRRQLRGAHAWTRAVIPGRSGEGPEFLVIGGMRCGTTSLHRFLAAHPDITPALGKELQYFTLHYGRGERWYRGNFPRRENTLSFEASPYYLFDPAVPERVAQTLPDVKLVALLRNPVDRAYSHYLHNRRRGLEPLTFAEAIEAEPARLGSTSNGRLASQRSVRLYSYASRGCYADQLQRWWAHVPAERLHVARSEDLFAQPQAELDRLADFLGIRRIPAAGFDRHGTTGSGAPPMEPSLRELLEERFAQPNERLGRMLGWATTWAPGSS